MTITVSGNTIIFSDGSTQNTAAVSVSSNSSYTRNSFTATSGQNTFSTSYTTGYVEIYLNGVLLSPSDYSANNGTSIILTQAASANDVVDVVAYNPVSNVVSSGGLTTYSYDNRGTLRTLSPSANLTTVIVEGLGLFTYYAAGNSDPDDDESCFIVNTGPAAWLLTSPSWDLVSDWQEPDFQSFLSRWPGRILFGTQYNSISTLTAPSQVSFNILVPGAQIGDIVVVSPYLQYDTTGLVNHWGYVSSAGVVTSVLNTTGNTTVNIVPCNFNAVVIRTN